MDVKLSTNQRLVKRGRVLWLPVPHNVQLTDLFQALPLLFSSLEELLRAEEVRSICMTMSE